MRGLHALAAAVLSMAALLGPGCNSSKSGQGSETHWLSACDTDATCGAGMACICGTCTLPCSGQADCAALGSSAVCAKADAAIQACAGFSPPAASLCLAGCTTLSDCFGGNSCVSGTCVPSPRRNGDAGVDASVAGSSGGTAGGGASGAGGTSRGGVGGTSGNGGVSADAGSGGRGGSGPGGSPGTPDVDSGSADVSVEGGAGAGVGGAGGRDASVDGAALGGPRVPGHLVLLGLTTLDPDPVRLLENSIFLANTTGTVRVLETGDASQTTDPLVTTYAGTIGRTIAFSVLSDPHALAAELTSKDVLLVLAQETIGSVAVGDLVSEWVPIIETFLSHGGVVVVDSGAASTWKFASGPGLLSVPGVGVFPALTNGGVGSVATQTGRDVELATPSDPVASGLPQHGTETPGSIAAFPGTIGGTVVVRDRTYLEPVVIHLVYTRCGSSADCETESVDRSCDVVTGRCVQCRTDLECSANEHCVAEECKPFTPCTTYLDCTREVAGRTLCDPSSSVCVECITSADCGQGQTCASGNVCRTPCADSSACIALATTKVCDTSHGTCAECVDETTCPANDYCDGGRCVHDACVAGTRVCDGNSVAECDERGATTTTTACVGLAVCVESNGTAACDEVPDSGPRCPTSCPLCNGGFSGEPGCCTTHYVCGCPVIIGGSPFLIVCQ